MGNPFSNNISFTFFQLVIYQVWNEEQRTFKSKERGSILIELWWDYPFTYVCFYSRYLFLYLRLGHYAASHPINGFRSSWNRCKQMLIFDLAVANKTSGRPFLVLINEDDDGWAKSSCPDGWLGWPADWLMACCQLPGKRASCKARQ